MSVIYIFFYSLTSRTRNDATVELIVRKNLLLRWSFESYILQSKLLLFQDKKKIGSNALTKLRSENLWKLQTEIIIIDL